MRKCGNGNLNGFTTPVVSANVWECFFCFRSCCVYIPLFSPIPFNTRMCVHAFETITARTNQPSLFFSLSRSHPRAWLRHVWVRARVHTKRVVKIQTTARSTLCIKTCANRRAGGQAARRLHVTRNNGPPPNPIVCAARARTRTQGLPGSRLPGRIKTHPLCWRACVRAYACESV